MSLTIHNLCDNILNSVRISNLNYACQEKPYSIFLTIRKSWRKGQHVQQLGDEYCQQLPESASNDKINSKDEKINDLKCEVGDLKAKLEASKHVEDDLRAQLDKSVVEVSRLKEAE